MIKQISVPDFVLDGIKPLRRRAVNEANLRVFGLDTETYRGKPVSVQASDGKDVLFAYVTEENIFKVFWDWIRPRLRRNGVNICYVHNLSFDLRVLFCAHHKDMYRQFSDIRLNINGVKIEMLYGKINAATLSFSGGTLKIYDSKSFTLASLKNSLKMFQVDSEKFSPPDDLGQFDPRSLPIDDPKRLKFEEYARQDAIAEHALGAKIVSYHKAFDVSPTISLPSFSAKIFRSRFLEGNTIPFPPGDVLEAAELSFHGGKNGKYPDDGPKSYGDLYEIDINSAYPAAMADFPGLTGGRYEKVSAYRPGFLGVYCLTGRSMPNPYPVIFDHAFNPVKGDFDSLWHTGYETELALRPGSGVSIADIHGFIWVPDKGAINPLGAFVSHFYGLKEKTAKSDPYYVLYKIILNALFGKFVAAAEIQKFEDDPLVKELRQQTDFPSAFHIASKWDSVLQKRVAILRQFRAGGLYNPFIATQITGHARSKLYELETKYGAVHSATDSIKTDSPVVGVPGLGGYKLECHGRCDIFRNKLYLHFAKDYSLCKHKDEPIRYPDRKFIKTSSGGLEYVPHPKAGQIMEDHGQHLCKYALHAYKGPLWRLFEERENILKGKDIEYEYVHVVGLREGLKRNETPCDFVVRSEELNLKKPVLTDKETDGEVLQYA